VAGAGRRAHALWWRRISDDGLLQEGDYVYARKRSQATWLAFLKPPKFIGDQTHQLIPAYQSRNQGLSYPREGALDNSFRQPER
jgi:hypothetical protein